MNWEILKLCCVCRCDFAVDTEGEEAEMAVDRQAEVMDHEMTDQESTSRQHLPDNCGELQALPVNKPQEPEENVKLVLGSLDKSLGTTIK